MSDLYEPQISTALHDRVDGISPDLSSIAAGALRQGTRIRRRRTATTVAAAFAVVGVVGGTVATAALLGDDSSGGGRSEAPVLGQPEAGIPFTFVAPAGWQCADPVEQEFGCTRGAEEISVGWKALTPGQRWEWGTDTGTESSYGIVGTSPDGGYGAWIEVVAADGDPIGVRDEFVESIRWDGEDQTGDQQVVGEAAPPGAGDAPFVLDLPAGWTCGTYADEKVACDGPGGGLVTIIARPAEQHAEWSTSTDKGGPGTGVRVSDVHGDLFVSIQPTTATEAQLDDLEASLTWTDGTPVF